MDGVRREVHMSRDVASFLVDNNRRTFVIGPIGKPRSATRKRSDTILDLLIKPATKACGFEFVVRADQIADPGSIPDLVIQRLLEDELVIADLHEHNPNVFY